MIPGCPSAGVLRDPVRRRVTAGSSDRSTYYVQGWSKMTSQCPWCNLVPAPLLSRPRLLRSDETQAAIRKLIGRLFLAALERCNRRPRVAALASAELSDGSPWKGDKHLLVLHIMCVCVRSKINSCWHKTRRVFTSRESLFSLLFYIYFPSCGYCHCICRWEWRMMRWYFLPK